MIADSLKQLGLKEKEALLYVELVRLGPQAASSLARHLRLPRSSTQFVSEQLAQKGFVRKSIKNGVTIYTPESLSNIKLMFELQAQQYLNDVEEKKKSLGLLDSLLEEQNPPTYRPKVIFFEGVDNVVQSFLHFLETIPKGDTIYNYVSPATEQFPVFRKGMQEFIKLRFRKQVFCKTISTLCEDAVRLKVTDHLFMRETLITSQKKPFLSEILIHDTKILSTSYTDAEIFSSVMMDADLARMNKEIFQMAWKSAEREDRKICRREDIQKLMKRFNGLEEY